MRNADLPQKEQWKLLTDAIANDKNAFSVEDLFWGDFNNPTKFPKDSFQGEYDTQACILSWAGFLGLDIYIPDSIDTPDPSNSNAKHQFDENPQWFTRKKTVLILKHYIATAKWDDDGNMIKQGKVDWLLDEREAA